MTNYKEIADIVMQNTVKVPTLNAKGFADIMKQRKFKFVESIDEITLTDGTKGFREVWGNSNFQVIVLRTANNNYKIYD